MSAVLFDCTAAAVIFDGTAAAVPCHSLKTALGEPGQHSILAYVSFCKICSIVYYFRGEETEIHTKGVREQNEGTAVSFHFTATAAKSDSIAKQ